MKLDQTEVSSLEYLLIFYSRRRKYFRHNSNFHYLQEDWQTHDSRYNHFPRKFEESGNHNQPRFGERFHVSHLNTNGADSSLKIRRSEWKIPDAVPNSPTIPWFFVKMWEFFKFPDNSLILRILLITVNPGMSFLENFGSSPHPTKNSTTHFSVPIIRYNFRKV